MKKDFLNHIRKEKLFVTGDNILLAVSGGRDSVAMAELFSSAGLRFAIAHCNFMLRGKESEGDSTFVQQLAIRLQVPFYVKRFNTKKYAKDHKVSLQMAARELRYTWFEEVLKNEKYRYLATAHHKDDVVETFFIKLLRGSGLRGLGGIRVKQGNIIRPLLFASREQINAFVKKNKIRFREDSSNREDKYMRNKLRLKLIPLMKQINPGLEDTILATADRIMQAEEFIRKRVEKKSRSMVKQQQGKIMISIKGITKTGMEKIFLYHLLSPVGFTNERIDEIASSLTSRPGKWFYSPTHCLLKDREHLVLAKIDKEKYTPARIGKNDKKIKEPLPVLFERKTREKDFRIPSSAEMACLDYSKLRFPLHIRNWKPGDYFYPLGMKGKKKLSDFFTDKKLSGLDKKQVFVLVSGGDIAWVIGYRIDERYKISPQTKEMFVCTAGEM